MTLTVKKVATTWMSASIFVWLLCCAASSQAKLNILVVHAYESHLPWVAQFTAGILDWQKQEVELYNEYLDAERLGHQSQRAYVDYLLNRYEPLAIDAILLNSSAASVLVKEYEAEFNRISPVRIHYSMLDIPLSATEVLISPDFTGSVQQTMRLAHQLQPNIEEVLIIEGPTFVDRGIAPAIKEVFADTQVTVNWLQHFTLAELDAAVAALPSQSAIFVSLVFSDTDGNQHVPKAVARRIVELSEVPVYTLYGTFMGTGAIGGYLFDAKLVAQEMLDAASDLLVDEQLSREYRAEVPIFDVTALKRFAIKTDLLPDQSVLLNQPLSFVQRYPRAVEAIIALLTLALCLFLTWLAWQRWYNIQLQTKNMLLNRLKSELTTANARLQELAMYDSLTGLLNRQAAEPLLTEAASRLRRYHTPAVLLVIDIDNFKQVNDQYGHKVGDDVLKAVSRALKNGVRDSDVVARWGGEEFVVLLSNAELAGAQVVARSLCQSIADLPQQPSVTVSVGGAALKIGESWSEAFKLADEQLYDVKATGKNSVKFAS